MSKREREGGYGDQLEESAPGVLGVGQARRGGHAPRAAEQVADLDHDECQKEEVQKTEHNPYFGDAERVLWDVGSRSYAGPRHQSRQSTPAEIQAKKR